MNMQFSKYIWTVLKPYGSILNVEMLTTQIKEGSVLHMRLQRKMKSVITQKYSIIKSSNYEIQIFHLKKKTF